MAFPTTGLLDDFNRGNTGPPPSADWEQLVDVGEGEWKVVGTECVVDSVDLGIGTNYWDKTSFGPDSECYATVITKAANNYSISIWARIDNEGSVNVTAYLVAHMTSSSEDEFSIVRFESEGLALELGLALGDSLDDGLIEGDSEDDGLPATTVPPLKSSKTGAV
ncbi:unnamed protein product [marine sediment metagenome]|uniref:Uncharacterized protein n=1 Tax=marine sediment metagenome TaxID=412755 RepID=X1C2R3_9ZZZZ